MTQSHAPATTGLAGPADGEAAGSRTSRAFGSLRALPRLLAGPAGVASGGD